MNAHLALQSRVHDHEQQISQQDTLRPANCDEDHAELDAFEAAAEAEVEVEMEVEGDCVSDAAGKARERECGKEGEADEQVQGRERMAEEWMRCPFFL
jgi:hypothetical protein